MCAQCGCEVPKENHEDRDADREERKPRGAFTFDPPAPTSDDSSLEKAS